MYTLYFFYNSDASIKIKSADFTSGNRFTLGIPISVACKDEYNCIAYITKSYWIYCIAFYMYGDANYSLINTTCIVYYI